MPALSSRTGPHVSPSQAEQGPKPPTDPRGLMGPRALQDARAIPVCRPLCNKCEPLQDARAIPVCRLLCNKCESWPPATRYE